MELPAGAPAEVRWVAERFSHAWRSAEQARAEREEAYDRLRSLVENAAAGICQTDPEGRVQEVNRSMVALLGCHSARDLVGTPLADLFADPGERDEALAAMAKRETFSGLTSRWKARDGRTLHVRMSGRHVGSGASGGAVLGRELELMVEDVTEARELEDRYAQLQKMEALGRLAGGIAHDFNNLLTVVQGQADLLRDDPDLDDDQREQAEEIYHAAVRGAALNHQLLAFGRRSPAEPKLQNLNEVIAGFELVLRRALGEDVRLSLALSPDVGLVLADQAQLEQVLMNLVVNARDAMPEGGALQIRTYEEDLPPDEAMVQGVEPGRQVVLSVRDSGEGIPPEVLPHIFEPFYSTKASAKGTGLGLATVYGIVTNAGGHIRVDSAPGEGTHIRIYLPRREGEAAVADAPSAYATAREGTGTILLVEDEHGVRRLTQRVLEGAGYRVVSAPDGLEALRAAEGRDAPFDLLVTDVVMPGLRGHQVAARLAASGKIHRALFVSGYADGLPTQGPDGVEEWAFLAKPFSRDELLETVQRLIRTA